MSLIILHLKPVTDQCTVVRHNDKNDVPDLSLASGLPEVKRLKGPAHLHSLSQISTRYAA